MTTAVGMHVERQARFLPIALVALVLVTGCVSLLPEGVPPYLVLLTSAYPSTKGRCTGVLIANDAILTAAHCADIADRAATMGGFEAKIQGIAKIDEGLDLAILTPDRGLVVDRYASFAGADDDLAGVLYGACPWYFITSGRVVWYMGEEEVRPFGVAGRIRYQVWDVPVNPVGPRYICGGDSGGVVLQGDTVVGLTSAVQATWWFPVGTRVYAIPGETILAFIKD